MATGDDSLLPLIRERVKEGLTSSAAFARLQPAERAKVANDTVRAFHYILGGADGRSRPGAVTLSGRTPVAAMADKPPLPEGDTAGSRMAESGAISARQGSDAFTEMIQKVDFPQFVAGLIDGVFNAIVNSSIKQMEAYAELVKQVGRPVHEGQRQREQRARLPGRPLPRPLRDRHLRRQAEGAQAPGRRRGEPARPAG
jgi:hypothetical protein